MSALGRGRLRCGAGAAWLRGSATLGDYASPFVTDPLMAAVCARAGTPTRAIARRLAAAVAADPDATPTAPLQPEGAA